jgi:phosphoglycerate dehydrogenase-like enzyme
MRQPVIYLKEALNEAQIESIKKTAPEFSVIDASKNNPTVNENDITIMLGWDRELGERLLNNEDSQLKWIQTISAGVDMFDFEILQKKGILLSNASGIHSISISEHVLGVLLTQFRGIRQSIQVQAEKHWTTNLEYRQLSGSKMLVVGTGHIGQQLARFAKGLNLQVYGINTTGHSVENFIECYPQTNMAKVLKEMPIVVNILPLTDHTNQIYNKELFAEMKAGTVFINVGRGASVVTTDLIEALNNGQIAYAALDVFEEEPLPKDSPLWHMENVLITPHISGLTPKFKTKLMNIFLPNLKSFLSENTLVKNNISLSKKY